jgi:mono/diheme cytochrome c family protein
MNRVKQIIVPIAAAALLAACTEPGVSETRSGAQLFANHCAACHGRLGEGDGPVAAIMTTNVPNLRTLAQRNNGTFPLDSVRGYIDGRELPVSHGDRQMPIWGDIFGWGSEEQPHSEQLVEQRINAVVDHLRAIQY